MARRGRRRPADAAGVRLVLHPARRRRQRDDAQRDQPRHEGAHRPPRPARRCGSTTSTPTPDRGRGDRPLGDAGDPLPPHGHRGHRARRAAIARRRQGRAVLQVGQPRRAGVRATRTASTSPARSQPAQVGFGAGGPHFCLGANLARREITVMFDEIRRRLPDLRDHRRARLPPEPFINGIKRLPCDGEVRRWR